MDDSTGFVVPALAGPDRLKAGLHASSVSSMSRSPQYAASASDVLECRAISARRERMRLGVFDRI
jgi:hypothetical protein